jgi:hypothetical protein
MGRKQSKELKQAQLPLLDRWTDRCCIWLSNSELLLLLLLLLLLRLQYEPGEGNAAVGNSVTARYTLSVWNLTPGVKYTTYRLTGRLPPRKCWPSVC